MSKTAIAIFKGSQQMKGAIQEIQGGSLANSKISVMIRSQFIHQGEFREEIANELAYHPNDVSSDIFNAWLVQAPPFDVLNLGEVVVAGPLANELMHQAQGRGLVEALVGYGLSEMRAKHYEQEVRVGHWLVLIQTDQEKINKLANTLSSYGGRDIEKWSTKIEHPIHRLG